MVDLTMEDLLRSPFDGIMGFSFFRLAADGAPTSKRHFHSLNLLHPPQSPGLPLPTPTRSAGLYLCQSSVPPLSLVVPFVRCSVVMDNLASQV